MFKLVSGGIIAVVAACVALGSCSTVPTGAVGVKTTFSQVDMGEVDGFIWKAPVITDVTDYVIKETEVDLKGLTPKAKDNLSLKNLEVAVYYRINPAMVAETVTKFASSTAQTEDGERFPGWHLVQRNSSEAVNDAVASLPSLTIHTQRAVLAATIKNKTQALMDSTAPNTFTVTRVVIQAVDTDPSIESSIQANIIAQKNLERMATQEDIARKNADIKAIEADGIARANNKINGSLTREYLQHEYNQALFAAATNKKGINTIIPATGNIAPLVNVGR